MPFVDVFEQSKRWMSECVSLIDGVGFSTTDRARVSISLHHLCMEHHKGIHTLMDFGIFDSALALIRPQIEAYLRGAWFHLCANETDIIKFLNGDEPPYTNTLIQQLETKEAFKEGLFSLIKQEAWSTLCDFTHGGTIQVRARNYRDEIRQSYKPEFVAELLTFSATPSMLAGVDIAAVIKSDDLATNMYDAYNAIYQTAA